MRKLFILSAIIGILTLLTSCEKDYTCECRTTNTLVPFYQRHEIKDAKKKDAAAECIKHSTTGTRLEFSCRLK